MFLNVLNVFGDAFAEEEETRARETTYPRLTRWITAVADLPYVTSAWDRSDEANAAYLRTLVTKFAPKFAPYLKPWAKSILAAREAAFDPGGVPERLQPNRRGSAASVASAAIEGAPEKGPARMFPSSRVGPAPGTLPAGDGARVTPRTMSLFRTRPSQVGVHEPGGGKEDGGGDDVSVNSEVEFCV